MALYRKYRPQSFDDLKGQSSIQTTLLEALKQNKLVHAYLFSGPRGTGKTTTARLIAKAIQCEKRLETGEACGECEICKINAKGELVDLVEIDAASNRGIDEIRDLREKIRFAPTRAASKVYIIDEVHMLTKEAFNALLKSLEEPPSHVYFILATTELHKIPETILSRCQRYDFKRISDREIMERLEYIAKKEKIEFEPMALELLAKHAEGGMRDAISLFEQFATEVLTEARVRDKLGLTSHQSCEELFAALGSADGEKGLKVIEQLYQEGADLQQFTTSFLSYLRGKLHAAVKEKKNAVIPKLLDWAELFDDAWMKLKRASIATLPLEVAVLRATQAKEVESVPTAVSTAAPASVAVKTTAPLVQPIPSKRPEGLAGGVHMDAVRAQLPAVLAAISTPMTRSSFKTGQLKDVQGEHLTFVFSTRFHLSKVEGPEALAEIENAFKKVLAQDTKIHFVLEEILSAPMATSVAVQEQAAPAAAVVDSTDIGWDTVEEPL
ncbi:MAG: DNA polymerase III subunit gamma/tau [Patescibacteria group bacterium]